MARAGKALEFDGYGGVEALHFVDQPIPEPGDGEVVIEVVTADVNHFDTYVRTGELAEVLPLRFPARQGSSFAGIVRAAGPNVKGFPVGTEVLGHDPAHGAHANHVVVGQGVLVKRPADLPWEVAGSLFLVGLTAYRIVQSLQLWSGDVVVITAAAGAVGHLQCQIARLAGATVIGIADADNHDYLQSIGVLPVGYGAGAVERIRELAADRPITALIDNSGRYADLARQLGVPRGRFVPTSRRREVQVGLYLAEASDPEPTLTLGDIVELVRMWGLRVLVSGLYRFDDIIQALTDLDARHSRGVVVLRMGTPAPGEQPLRGKLRTHYEEPHS